MYFCSGARRGKPAELFRADRYQASVLIVFYYIPVEGICSVISGVYSEKAGADEDGALDFRFKILDF